MTTSPLFEKIIIGGITAPNRIMRSPTFEGLAGEKGEMTPVLAEKMLELARGGVGIITFSHTFALEDGRASPKQLGLASDDVIASYGDLISEIHKTGAVVGIQITHAGCFGVSPANVGPSDLDFGRLGKSKEASKEDIEKIVAAFVAAAKRAETIGFDYIMIHAAHGYLLSEFLSPIYNKRTDEYGGSIENRARLLLRIVKEVRAAVKKDIPIAVKMNVDDFHENGYSLEESTKVAVWLAKEGVELLEASGGTFVSDRSKATIRNGPGGRVPYHKEGAHAWKKALAEAGLTNVRVALVGGVRKGEDAEEALKDGSCDIISMSRALIREPDLPTKWKENPKYVSECTSCGACLKAACTLKGYACQIKK